MLSHHLCTAQGHGSLCWHGRGCSVPCPFTASEETLTLLPHPSHPSPSDSLPGPWLTLSYPANCSRAAQPPHDHFEDTSQDTPNSAPSPKHHRGPSPRPWAPLTPACFWSLFSSEVPKGDSGLGAGSAQLPAWGAAPHCCLQHPQIPSDMHHGLHSCSHPLQEQRGAW